jgi:hypothetical protein
MTNKIDKKIVGYKVKTEETLPKQEEDSYWRQLMSEHIERPDFLIGSTYKIKTPNTEHALYLTINDIILNEGTEHEQRHPYEVFINTKDVNHFQWVIALTRLLSAVFRKGGDITFIVEEMKQIFDPKGGYHKKGMFVPSLIADIGLVLEKHFKKIGLIKEEKDEHMKKFLEKKKEELGVKDEFPPSATVCGKCSAKAVVLMDGCQTCLNCGDSKCN